jgi:creatinine amidohydrolase/Fe(II)-dependent formamide hydrolase-like protein
MGHPQRASRQLGERIVEGTVKAASEKIMELESKADGVYKKVSFTPEPIIF